MLVLSLFSKENAVVFPVIVHKVAANAKIKEDSNKVAFEYGPMVYCGEEIDNQQISDITIPEDIILSTEERNVLTEKVTAVKGKTPDEEFTLIPYYLWSNRGIGKMRIWFPKKN